ncbi:hypothetical protein L7F22_034200 [Adiantum nelumboides]|nr:hypothetical protein [Adiantum nelumboides]
MGKRIHVDITSEGLLKENIVLGTAFVNMYAKCGVLQKAQRIILELYPIRILAPLSYAAGLTERIVYSLSYSIVSSIYTLLSALPAKILFFHVSCHIKAIITAEEVLFSQSILYLTDNGIAEESGNEPQKLRQASKSRPSGTQDIEQDPPFEFRALEVALKAICSFVDARTTELGSDVHPAFDELTAKISSRNLDKVRKLKTAMTRLTTRVQKVRDELEQLLDDDSDMAELFLTRKLQSLASPEHGQAPLSLSAGFSTTLSRASRASIATCGADDDVEEVERLLEAYFMRIDETLNKLLALREYIDDTEDYINFQLDKHRNRLIQVHQMLSWSDLKKSFLVRAVVLSVYAAVAGIFGMNVQYTWMIGHSHVFKWVVLLSGLVSLILFALILSYARSGSKNVNSNEANVQLMGVFEIVIDQPISDVDVHDVLDDERIENEQARDQPISDVDVHDVLDDERIENEQARGMPKWLVHTLRDSKLDAPLSNRTRSGSRHASYASDCYALAVSSLHHTLCDLPLGKKAIGIKRVYKLKRKPDGEIDRYNARLFAKDYAHKKGIDYEETFAPTFRTTTVRFLCALAAHFGWDVHQSDIVIAFLNSDIFEEVYVTQLRGFVKKGQEDKVCKCHKALYGLKQSLRTWYEKADTHMVKQGFRKSPTESTLYVKREGDVLLIVVLYVDDLLLHL